MKSAMKSLLWITIPASLAIVGVAVYIQQMPPRVASNQPNLATGPRHPITTEMAKDAEARPGQPAPEIRLPDADGNEQTLTKFLETGPVLLVMVKDGCPCNLESQEFFNQISRNYVGKATVVGVMDADKLVASKYRDDLNVPFPILTETTGATFKTYRAEQSVYTFLIGKDGILKKVWPGYSAAMLIEANELLASESGVPSKELDVTRAAKEMTSGCYFFQPNN